MYFVLYAVKLMLLLAFLSYVVCYPEVDKKICTFSSASSFMLSRICCASLEFSTSNLLVLAHIDI